MALIDQIASIILNSKKGSELPIKVSLDGTEWVLFYNENTKRVEKSLLNQLFTDIESKADLNNPSQDIIANSYTGNGENIKNVGNFQLSYLEKIKRTNQISYKYLYRDANYLNIVYVYGDKAISYRMAIENNEYLWINRIYLQGVNVNGLADGTTTNTLASDVQEYAFRYRKNGTTDATVWTPNHGALSAVTELDSLSINIDGIEYQYLDIPQDENFIFEEITINQDVSVKYDAGSTYQFSIKLTHKFDDNQLSYKNEYIVLEDIEVLRMFGSRLTLFNGNKISLDNTYELTSINDNNTTFGSDLYNSAIIESNDTIAVNELGNFKENTSFNKPFNTDTSNWSIWDRTNGVLVLYNHLSDYNADDNDLTLVPANTVLNSSNTVYYVPKSYNSNNIDININQSNGLLRRLGNLDYLPLTGGTLTDNLSINKVGYSPASSVFSQAHLTLKTPSNPAADGGASIALPISSASNYGITLNSVRRDNLASRPTFSVRKHISNDIGEEIFRVDEEKRAYANEFIKNGATNDDVLLGDGSTTSLSGIGGLPAGFYDEGTFTPTLVDQTAGAIYTYTVNKAYYVRTGNLVTLEINFGSIETTGTPSAMLQIQDLPFDFITDASGSCSIFHGGNVNFYEVEPLGVNFGAQNYIAFNKTTSNTSGLSKFSSDLIRNITITSGNIVLTMQYITNVYTP